MMEANKVTLEAEFLYTIESEIKDPIIVAGGPNGTRAIVEFVKGTGKIYGPALNGTIVGPTSDWITVGTDGSFALDVRVLIQTEDGQIIYKTVVGRSNRDEDNPSNATIQCAATYQTSPGKYQYLNNKVLTGYGRKTGNSIKISYYDTRGVTM